VETSTIREAVLLRGGLARVAYAVVKHDQPSRGYHEHALPSGSIPLKRAVGAHATP